MFTLAAIRFVKVDIQHRVLVVSSRRHAATVAALGGRLFRAARRSQPMGRDRLDSSLQVERHSGLGPPPAKSAEARIRGGHAVLGSRVRDGCKRRGWRAGRDAQAILARLDQLIAGFHIYFVVDTLEYLQKGGRIGKAAALLGTALQMKPLLALEDGIVEPKGRIRSKSKAVARILELAVQETAGRKCLYLGILHAAAVQEAEQLKADLVSQLAPGETIMAEVGPIITTHTGPGVVGAVFYAE
jgi:hypothetical protein